MEVVGTSEDGIAVSGISQRGEGVRGVSLNGPGVVGKGNPAGRFEGLLDIEGSISARGNVSATGNLSADDTVKTNLIVASGNISAANVAAQDNISAFGNVNAGDTVNTTHLAAQGNVNANGDLNTLGTVNTVHVAASGNISAANVAAQDNISAFGNVNAGDTVNTTHLAAQGNVNANGDLNTLGTVNAQHVIAQGNISALNNVNAKNMHVAVDIILENADCAEEFEVEEGCVGCLAPGTVVVFGDEGCLRHSSSAYDKRVAGVISGAGEFKPGLILDRRSSDSNRLAIALMGKVFCKVDAASGPVKVGDLLTTSGTPGHAMKATDASQAFGAVIGKALRPLHEGKGLVPILVALQ